MPAAVHEISKYTASKSFSFCKSQNVYIYRKLAFLPLSFALYKWERGPGGEGKTPRIHQMHYSKKIFAQELRKSSTPEEQKVWKLLRNRNFMNLKFRRQHILQGFVVDFYCHKLRLAIEIDGKIHLKQKEYDALRQKLIEEKEITFIRITNEAINKDVNIVLEEIKKIASTTVLPSD